MKNNLVQFTKPVKKQSSPKYILPVPPEKLVHLMVNVIDGTNFTCRDFTKAFFTILEMCAKDLSDVNGKNIDEVRKELAETVKQAGDKFLYG